MSHKERVLSFIKHDRSLAGARNIYNSLPNKSLSFLASLNRMQNTEENSLQVAYQLCKAVGIAERQLTALWQNKVVPAPEPERGIIIMNTEKQPKETLTDRLLSFDAATAEWPDIQAFASDVSEETGRAPEGRKKEDLLSFLQAERETAIAAISDDVPIKVKQTIKLREQFPFLRDEDCPNVLKVLVSDLITSYENYKAGRAKLFDSMTREEEAILSRDIVENFIENKQAFAELEYYAENGQLLREHPIFEELKIKEELSTLNAADLNKKYNALRKNISTNKKKAEEATDPEEKAKYEAARDSYAWQLEYVKELLRKK